MKKVLLLVCLLSTQAFASYPDASADCAHKKSEIEYGDIQEAFDIYFDHTCTNAYVGPPANGRLEVAKVYAMHSRVNDCQVVRDITAYQNDLTYQLKVKGAQAAAIEKVKEDSLKRKEAFEDLLLDKELVLDEARSLLKNIEAELVDLNKDRVEIKDQITDCNRRCQYLQNELIAIEEKIQHRQEALVIKQDRVATLQIDIDRIQADIDSSELDLESNIDELIVVQNEIFSLLKDVRTIKNNYYKDYAATFKIKLSLRWEELVKKLNALNQNLGLSFHRLTIHSSEFNMNTFDIETGLEMGHMVMDLGIPQPVFKIQGSTDPENVEGPRLNTKVFGVPDISLAINMGGVCNLMDENNQLIEDRLQGLGAHVSPIIYYTYMVKENVGYKFSYNIHKSIDRVVEEARVNGGVSLSLSNVDNFLVDFKLDHVNLQSSDDRLRFIQKQKLRHASNIFSQLLRFTGNTSLDANCSSCMVKSYNLDSSLQDLQKRAQELKVVHTEILNEKSNSDLYTLRSHNSKFKSEE